MAMTDPARAALQRLESEIRHVAQGLNSPACLAWADELAVVLAGMDESPVGDFEKAVQRLVEYAGPLSVTGRPAHPQTEIVVNREWFERCIAVVTRAPKWLAASRDAVPPREESR